MGGIGDPLQGPELDQPTTNPPSGVRAIPVGEYVLGQPAPDQAILPQKLLPYQMEDDEDIDPTW